MTYSDPHVPVLKKEGVELCGEAADEAAAEADCVVIVTDHSAFDYAKLVAKARLIVDTRNAMKGIESTKIVRL